MPRPDLPNPPPYLSPEGFCFILNLDSNDADDILEFQLLPRSIGEGKSANYDQIPIIGRSLPHLGYAHSSSRQTNLSLEFASLKAEGKYSPTWVQEQVRWLEAKVYPRYEDIWVYPPPRLQLVMGYAFSFTCVMQSVNTTWLSPWHVENDLALPFRAQVDISLIEYGRNEDEFDHPHSHDQAQSGENQAFLSGTGTPYIEIPLAVATGG